MSLIFNVQLDALVFVVKGISKVEDMDAINKGFSEIAESETSSRNHKTGNKEFSSGGYQRSIKIMFTSNSSDTEPKIFQIYIDPFNSEKAFLKVALMKHPYTKSDYKFVNRVLRCLFKYCKTNHLNATHIKIKKADIAIDKKVTITNLWFNNSRTQVAMHVFGKSGELETIYLGNNRAALRIRIYNKAAQMKSKQHKHKIQHALLRVEFSVRPDCAIDELFDVIDMEAKLKKFTIYKAKAIREAGIFSDEITSLIDYVGIKSILQSMDQSSRRKALKEMKPFRSNLISKEKLETKLETLDARLKYLYAK